MNSKIPAVELILEEEENRAVQDVLNSGHIASGPKVQEFEKKFAEYVGVTEAVAVSSGTSALISALLAAGVGKGDEVIVPPYSFISSVSSVLLVGATPVFVDIELDSYCLDPHKIEESLSDDTKAIIPVHLYGQPADMDKITEIAQKNDLIVIEDSCQAHGAECEDKKTGSIGDMGCFSFYATKNMTTGEGGMVTTDNKEYAEKIRMIREHGRSNKDGYEIPGYNFLMTDLQAAIGIVQLEKLDELNEKRRRNAEILNDGLESEETSGIVKRPLEIEGTKHVYHQYALRLIEGDKNRLVRGMKKAGIEIRVGYDKPIYKQPAINIDIECSNTETACKDVVWIPVHPKLEAKHMRRISWGLKHFF